jgi:hypothetical protein
MLTVLHEIISGYFKMESGTLDHLVARELRFDEMQKCRQSRNVCNVGVMDNITSDQRDIAAEWMYEVVIDSNGPETSNSPKTSNSSADVFLHAVTLMDCFLDICPILTNQVQLLASACLLLAAKVGCRIRLDQDKCLDEDTIIDYTDNSITKMELKVSTCFLNVLYFNNACFYKGSY